LSFCTPGVFSIMPQRCSASRNQYPSRNSPLSSLLMHHILLPLDRKLFPIPHSIMINPAGHAYALLLA
jgi:hypothetical protein